MTKELKTPQKYYDVIKDIPTLWEGLSENAIALDEIVSKARKILLDAGYSATQAMYKISEDHKQLKRFSLKNIYKMLASEEKRDYVKKDDIYPNAKSINDNNVMDESSKPIVITPEELKPKKDSISHVESFRQEHGKYVEQKQEQEDELEIIHISAIQTGNLFMSMMQKKNYWKYAENVAFEWNKTKKTLKLIFN